MNTASNTEYNRQKRKEWKENNPEKSKEWKSKSKGIRKNYYVLPLCEYDVQWRQKKEKGTLHQENVRKQTHPEELESEDEPNSTVIFWQRGTHML